jgi:tetrahydromethanopterin S-methyltransferase subunit A
VSYLNVEEKQVDKVQDTVDEDTAEEEIPDLLEMEEEEEDEEEENVQGNPIEINLHLFYINVFNQR